MNLIRYAYAVAVILALALLGLLVTLKSQLTTNVQLATTTSPPPTDIPDADHQSNVNSCMQSSNFD